jgi:hypothetical protein
MIAIKQNLELLYQLLNEVVIGKVYYGINQSDEVSHSLMPFIVYQEINNRALTYADNQAILRLSTIQITLVTEKKDPLLESKLEQVLGNNGFNYQMVTEYLNSDQSINRVYEIKMEVMP